MATKTATRLLINAQSFPPGTPQQFKDVFLRMVDILNGTQTTAYGAEETAGTAQETASGAAEVAGEAKEGVEGLTPRVDELEENSVSTSNAGLQTLLGALGLGGDLQINGTTVVKEQQTGWTDNTGTAKKGGVGDLTLPVSATYTAAEVEAIANAVIENRQLLTAVIHLLMYHGLAGA